MSIVVFWVVTSCSLVGGYRSSGGTYRLHPQGRTRLYDVTIWWLVKYEFNNNAKIYP
jgi:hypothetical protein